MTADHETDDGPRPRVPEPGQTLSAADLQALGNKPEPENLQDIDVDTWLGEQARAADRTDYFVIDGKRLRISAISDGERSKLLKVASRPDPSNPRGEKKLNPTVLRREYIALSLTKAGGRTVFADELTRLPGGVIDRLFDAINELSQSEAPEQQTSPFTY
jgi:hypothetical protein